MTDLDKIIQFLLNLFDPIKLGGNDDSMSANDPYSGQPIDLTSIDPYSAGYVVDSYTTEPVFLRDPSDGSVANPFYPPPPTDTSQWQAANDTKDYTFTGEKTRDSYGNTVYEMTSPTGDTVWSSQTGNTVYYWNASTGSWSDQPPQPPPGETPAGPRLARGQTDWQSAPTPTGSPAPWSTPYSNMSVAPSTTSHWGASASDYNPAVDRGDLPQIFSPPAAPPIETWDARLGLADPPAAPVSVGQSDPPGIVSQVLSGTYADSILRSQLANQGRVPGAFVSPAAPYDLLFNPNATSLTQAALLASRTPNFTLRQAEAIQLQASLTPFVGAISTWMHPESTPLEKGIAVLGVLADVSALGTALKGVAGVAPEAAALAPEFDAVAPELEGIPLQAKQGLPGAGNPGGITVKYLGETPIKGNRGLPWVVHQISATGSDTESIFLITDQNGVLLDTVEADSGLTRFLVEAKAAGFEGRAARDFGEQLFKQAQKYFTVADALGYDGIRYAAASESAAANLYKAFSDKFSEALSSGFLQIWWIESGAAYRYIP